MDMNMYKEFLKESFDLVDKKVEGGAVEEGKLKGRGEVVNIRNFIPRFYEENYCESFSFQWTRFGQLQLDSKNGFDHSERRMKDCTKWNLEDLKGKTVLECGCGPGRFTEIFLKAGAKIVGVDMSRAIDINLKNNKNKNLLLIQGDLTEMSFLEGKFDYVFCYGVIQHTPNPYATFTSLVKYLKVGGKISIDSYRKLYFPTGWSTPKYLWRPITKRMDNKKLLKIIQWYIPKYIKFDSLIRGISKIGIILTGFIPIPCWNYLNKGYSEKERVSHAIMDTFDALSPEYDNPKTIGEIKRWFGDTGLKDIDVFGDGNGVVGNGTKKSL